MKHISMLVSAMRCSSHTKSVLWHTFNRTCALKRFRISSGNAISCKTHTQKSLNLNTIEVYFPPMLSPHWCGLSVLIQFPGSFLCVWLLYPPGSWTQSMIVAYENFLMVMKRVHIIPFIIHWPEHSHVAVAFPGCRKFGKCSFLSVKGSKFNS